MAESLINTKRRIATIKSTEKITKAMKLVASVKFQRWKHYLDDDKCYFSNVEKSVISALNSVDFSHKDEFDCLVEYPQAKKKLYIVVSSSLGLCGAYNYNLFKAFDSEIKEDDEIFIIGNKGYTHYKNREGKLHLDYVDLFNEFSYGKIKHLRHLLVRMYKTGKYSSIELLYTSYKNSMTFIPLKLQLLPIDLKRLNINEDNDFEYGSILEPDEKKAINSLLPHYVDAQLFNKLIESQLSELSSRRNAMEAATDSADQIVSDLQIVYNKSRQSAITQEITEIVAGANAGKEKEN